MSVHVAAAELALPEPRPVPVEELTAAPVGPVPFNWLAPTGRLEQALTVWGRGHLAEVPAGLSFDVLLVPADLGRNVLARVGAAGVRPGPVVLGPAGAEFIVRPDSAADWCAPGSTVLRSGSLVLLPPPTALVPETVAGRGWLVPPVHRAPSAPPGAGVPSAASLLEPFLEAVQAASEKA
ncbi:hypothetical protein [Streptomyces sp. NPDC056291]|uniref:hypothetical protein n=1 Tax=Streptomyces sp. NPDC056291 TaxID=3345772 RepID=UPI0035D66932